MPSSKRRGKAKSNARQRRQQGQRQQRQEPPPDDATDRELRGELTEIGGNPSPHAKEKDLESAVALARIQFPLSTDRPASACRHGYRPPLSSDCMQLAEACFESFERSENPNKVVLYMSSLITAKFPTTWEDEFRCESIKAWAVSEGTSCILQAAGNYSFNTEGGEKVCWMRTLFHTILILMIENYKLHLDGHKKAGVQLSISRRLEHLIAGGQRAAMKFFLQRAHCSCLEDVYAEVKSQHDKLGLCHFCYEPTKVRKLWVCTRCNVADYCSKECQVADWPKHKKFCDAVKRNNLELVALSKPSKALTPFLNGPTRS